MKYTKQDFILKMVSHLVQEFKVHHMKEYDEDNGKQFLEDVMLLSTVMLQVSSEAWCKLAPEVERMHRGLVFMRGVVPLLLKTYGCEVEYEEHTDEATHLKETIDKVATKKTMDKINDLIKGDKDDI